MTEVVVTMSVIDTVWFGFMFVVGSWGLLNVGTSIRDAIDRNTEAMTRRK